MDVCGTPCRPGWTREVRSSTSGSRVAREHTEALTSARLAPLLLASVELYGEQQRWWPRLFLLMPDHLHALLSFPAEREMSEVVRGWKRWHARESGVAWQSGYFDHRIRDEESLREKVVYVLNNPVVKQLSERSGDWPWVVIEGKRR